MSLNEDVKGCRIVIRDVESGDTIADTTILSYHQESEQIEVAAEGISLAVSTTVSALIFSSAGLVESHGTVGEMRDGNIPITLYEGTAKNDRHAVRYQVNIQGQVDSITRPEEGKLPGGFEIAVSNMSSIGLLLQAPSGRIKEGDVVRFMAVSKGQRLIITVLAMRVEAGDTDMEKVGCSVQLVNLG